MKPEDYQRLKKLYESYGDTELLSMMQEGKDAYQEGVFDLLSAEVKRRRSPETVAAETAAFKDSALEEIIFVVIYAGQPETIQKLAFELEENGISTVMKDDNHPGVLKLAVEKSQVEQAQKMREEFAKKGIT